MSYLVQKQGFVIWKRFPYVVSPGMIHCTQFSESGLNALLPAGCLQFPYRILLIILIETFLDEWLQKCILSLPCIFKPSNILFTCFYLLNWSRNTNFGILHLPAYIFILVYFYLNSSIFYSNGTQLSGYFSKCVRTWYNYDSKSTLYTKSDHFVVWHK